MLVITHLLNSDGNLLTGASPILTILDTDGNVVVSSAQMTEIGMGFYKYDFVQYNNYLQYCFLIDCQDASQRYLASSNTIDMSNNIINIMDQTNFLKQVLTGRWKITNNQLIMYADDNTTEIARFNLYDENGNPTNVNVFDRQKI